MTKPRGAGFQKPMGVSEREVGLAIVKNDGRTCSCSCGWKMMHSRDKVREDKIDRHLNKQHNGKGIRL